LALELIAGLPIAVDQETAARAWREIIVTARAQGLIYKAYDAAYLELAIRRALPLLTKDGEFARAAKLLDVNVLP